MPDSDVAAAVVCFGAPESARHLERELIDAGVRVVVVQTGPTRCSDGSWIKAGNVGYGAAANAGYASLGSPTHGWFLVLNDDLQASPSAVRAFLSELRTYGVDVAIASPLGETRGYLASRVRDRLGAAPHGGALAVRADLFRELRGFDDRYFMYSEEIDLCLRVPDGMRSVQSSTAPFRHDGAASTRQRPAAHFEMARSAALLRAAHGGRARPFLVWLMRQAFGNLRARRPIALLGGLAGAAAGWIAPTWEGVAARAMGAAGRRAR